MKEKIFIVDDSKVNRNYLKAILEEHGFEVMEATRGGEALETIETTQPSLMILDLLMPGIGGMETLKSIRAKGYTFPIIIFTSDDREEVRKKCMEAGANEVLMKPSKPSYFMNIILKVLKAHAKA
jgi:two-component system response regulator MprA